MGQKRALDRQHPDVQPLSSINNNLNILHKNQTGQMVKTNILGTIARAAERRA